MLRMAGIILPVKLLVGIYNILEALVVSWYVDVDMEIFYVLIFVH